MTTLKSKTLVLWVVLSLFPFSLETAAQTEDIQDFLKAGQASYAKGRLDEAALEFENVLMIDKSNFLAKVFLAQIYIDRRDATNAKRLLSEACLQAPGHPKVQELQKLLGMNLECKKPDLVDPVIAETLGCIASTTRKRPFGIVIPEDKVVEENLEKKLLTFNDEVFDEKTAVIRNIERSRENLQTNQQKVDSYIVEKSDSLLEPVFEVYSSQGLNKALDKYFEMIMKDPSLASKDDRGLINEGNRVYSLRYSENLNDNEARYYYGALQYINGLYEDAEQILHPFRSNAGRYATRLAPFFAGLNKWREQEERRLAFLKYEEEQRLAKEAKEKEEAEKQKEDVWAKVKNRGAGGNDRKTSDLASAGTKAEAARIHDEAYKLYKRGKLDAAIERFNEAISKDGENPEYSYHLGLAWTDKGLAGDVAAFDQAITAYQKVISLSPEGKLAKDAESMINDIQQAKRSLGEN